MYNLKTIASKIITNLRIPAEREIKELQLQQVKRALKQSNDSIKCVEGAQLNTFRIISPDDTQLNSKNTTKTSNAFVKDRIKNSACA